MIFLHLANRPATEDSKTDAIVVLTGGPQRIKTALTLLSKGFSERLLISGVFDGVRKSEILEFVKETGITGIKEGQISLDHSATSTKENALETKKWVQENNIKSLRLVTESYHMPRSLLEFQGALEGISILPHPIATKDTRSEKWWNSNRSIFFILREYHKFLAVWLKQQTTKLSNLT